MVFLMKTSIWSNLPVFRIPITLIIFANSTNLFMASNRHHGPGSHDWVLHWSSWVSFLLKKTCPYSSSTGKAFICIFLYTWMTSLLWAPPHQLRSVFFINYTGSLLSRILVIWTIFLALKWCTPPKVTTLSQHKHIQDLLARSGITDTRTATTPMDLHLQLRPSDGTPLADPSRYRHIVGSLVYLTVTRPDIAHEVHILSQFVTTRTSVHYGHLLRVLRYLRGTSTRYLFYAQSSPLQLYATWANDVNDRCSAIVFFLVPLLFHRNLRNKLFLAPVMKQNFVHLPPLL